MNKDKLHTLLCVATAFLGLAGVGLILANVFFSPQRDLMPYAFICIIAGNAINLYRKIKLAPRK